MSVTPVGERGQNVGVTGVYASYDAVEPAFRAHTCTEYVPAARPVVFQVQVAVELYACAMDQEVPLYNQNWYW